MADDLTRKQTSLTFGAKGFDVVSANNFVNTSTNEDGYYAVKAIGASAQVDLTSVVGDSASNVSIAQSDVVVGHFSNVFVDSGTVFAYRR